MPFPHHLFRAYDIRGVVEEGALTPALVERIGRALAGQARARGIGEFVVARDGRLSGPRLAEALVRGLLESGCDVIDIGMAPTPVLYFTAAERGTGTGVQVTASHNPARYNGLKMMIGGDTLAGDDIQEIKKLVMDGEFLIGEGTLKQEDAVTAYRRKLIADIYIARPLKVVIDCGNGVAGMLAPDLFRDLGCEVIELYCEVDGAFPNHEPDPSRPENLRDLMAAVGRHEADFGMAFDGDGDRLGVVADGKIIWPDRQMLLCIWKIMITWPGAEIIYDVKCSRLVPQAIRAHGGVATMCKTGHSFIKNKLKETGAVFAGEMSGHLFFNDRWGGFDDGLYAGARLCELLSADPRPPGQVFAALPDTVNTPELRLEMEEGEPHALMQQLLANARFDDAEVSRLDGLRVDFENGFGLIRPSNTTPALIMRFEADTPDQLAAIQSRFRDLLRATRRDLELPF